MNYRDLTYHELENFIIEAGYPKFRAKQFFQWIHKNPIEDFSEITVFSKNSYSEGDRYGNQSGAFGYFSLSEV